MAEEEPEDAAGFEAAVVAGIAAKRKNRKDRETFDDDWLDFKDKLRPVFEDARDALKKHRIDAKVSDPNGDIFLEALYDWEKKVFRQRLTCTKGDLVIIITSSFRPKVEEPFGLDIAKKEVDCRIRKFLREVAAIDTAPERPL